MFKRYQPEFALPSEPPRTLSPSAEQQLNRRQFSSLCASGLVSSPLLLGSPCSFQEKTRSDSKASAGQLNLETPDQSNKQSPEFAFKYILGSCMYGTTAINDILPEATKIGANAIDIWPRPHGDQREQLDAMGEEKFAALLKKHNLTLGCITQYKLGPFGLQKEMQLAQRLGCTTMVTGGSGPKGLKGTELKIAVAKFVEQMKPHLEVAKKTGVTIAIENHANNVIDSPDSLKWLVEFSEGTNLAVALAPYHLEQDATKLAELIKTLGNRIAVFYAWQHGMGCMKKLPKEQELLQMPGRGKLDFAPLVKALKQINYNGWTEIFMHPVPRGIPILDTTKKVTEEINRARTYLERLI